MKTPPTSPADDHVSKFRPGDYDQYIKAPRIPSPDLDKRVWRFMVETATALGFPAEGKRNTVAIAAYWMQTLWGSSVSDIVRASGGLKSSVSRRSTDVEFARDNPGFDRRLTEAEDALRPLLTVFKFHQTFNEQEG